MKSNIPMPVAVAAAVVILLVIVVVGWRMMSTEPTATHVGTTGAKVSASPPPSVPGGPQGMAPEKASGSQPLQPAN